MRITFKKDCGLLSGFGVFIIILFLASCSTSYFPLKVLVPARVSLNRQIKLIGLVNRTLPHGSRRWARIPKGYILGETIKGDEIGARSCLDGLAEKLNNSPGVKAVILKLEMLKGGSRWRTPSPLSWGLTDRVCKTYKVDALIALESFDCDLSIQSSHRLVKRKVRKVSGGKKKTVMVPKYTHELFTKLKSGWKIYYPARRTVIDASVHYEKGEWEAEGYSHKEARKNLVSRQEALNQTGYDAGVQYGIRISPTWLDVNRRYYIKGNPEFKEAYRYVRSDDWESAVLIWERVLKNPDPELAGKAAYNIAVAAEVRGDLETALKWARESHQKYGIKSARRYVRTIMARIEDIARLRKQVRN